MIRHPYSSAYLHYEAQKTKSKQAVWHVHSVIFEITPHFGLEVCPRKFSRSFHPFKPRLKDIYGERLYVIGDRDSTFVTEPLRTLDIQPPIGRNKVANGCGKREVCDNQAEMPSADKKAPRTSTSKWRSLIQRMRVDLGESKSFIGRST